MTSVNFLNRIRHTVAIKRICWWMDFIYCRITALGIIILVKNDIMPYLFDDATNKFVTALDEILPLSDESKRDLPYVMTNKSLKEGEFLVKAGENPGEIYFLGHGLLRGYVLGEDKDSKKQIERFAYFIPKGELYFSLGQLTVGRDIGEYVQAVNHSRVICLSLDNLMNVFHKNSNVSFSNLMRLGKQIAERQNMKRKLLAIEPEKRLEFMRKIDPDLVRRVPEEYMRSYLGL